MLDNESLQLWTKLIKGDYDIHVPTFLIGTLIPFTENLYDNGDGLLGVNIKELKTGGTIVTAGIKLLIESGFAKEKDGFLILGYSPRMRDTQLFLFEQKELAVKRTKTASFNTAGKKSIIQVERIFNFEELSKSFTNDLIQYKTFCNTIGQPGSYNIVKDKLTELLTKGESGTIAPKDLLQYIDCHNAIVYEWTSLPKNITSNKASVAKMILNQYPLDRIFEVVPYFVRNYPKTAEKGWEETTIFTLKTHFNRMFLEMSKHKPKQKIQYGAEEDRL